MSALLSFGGQAAQATFLRLVQGWVLSDALSFTRGRPAAEISDEELVERARQKAPEAIQAIYQRHAGAVYRRFTHLLGPDPERACGEMDAGRRGGLRGARRDLDGLLPIR